MRKNLTVMLIVLTAAALVTVSSELLFPAVSHTRTSEILSVSVTGETLFPIDAPAQSRQNGLEQLETYQASRDIQGVAYCLVYRVDAGTEGQFEIAVGVDMSGTRVLGVRLLSDSLTVTDGSYVSWAGSGYLDVYAGLARNRYDTVEPLSVAPVSTRRIWEAVGMAFETVDVRKESEDTYE